MRNTTNVLILAAVGLLIGIAGCESGSEGDGVSDEDTGFSDISAEEDEGPTVELLKSELAREAPDDDAPVEEMVESLNTFSLRLLTEIRDENPESENIVFSPLSLYIPLSMARSGASGPTHDEMSEAMGVDLDDHGLLSALNRFDQGLMPESSGELPYVVKSTNGFWAQREYEFQQEFIDDLSRYFGESVRLVDFIHDHEALRPEINSWVEEETRGEIPELLAEGTPDEFTRLILVNTLLFDAPWLRAFTKDITRDFTTLHGGEKRVDMLNNPEVTHPYIYRDNAHWLELKTNPTSYSALVVMPDGNPVEFLEELSTAVISEAREEMEDVRMNVTFPMLDLESRTNFVEPLENMGMKLAFDPWESDFLKISDPRDSGESLYINDIEQLAILRADKERLTAAAATYVEIDGDGDSEADLILRIDQPFYLFITHNETGAILFISWITDPS